MLFFLNVMHQVSSWFLSGLQTSGYLACPICGPGLHARRSRALKKMIYEGHRAHLPDGHDFREGFLGRRPPRMCAKEWEDMKLRCHEGLPDGMKRFSILFELPYWTSLLINHLLDPMHIFKNVGSLLWDHISGAKDTHAARADLQEVGIMKELWPQTRMDGRITLPKAPWVMSKVEERRAKLIIRSLRTPTGLMRSLRTAFTKDGKLSGLKSHDWHKMCQVSPLLQSQ